jgi:peroxiredoxin
MVANLCLFTCVLATAQPTNGSDWLLVPRLKAGHELVYTGTFAEEAFGKGVQFARAYRLESRLLVVEASERGPELALLTTLKLRGPQNERAAPADPGTVRLELARLDGRGRTLADLPGLLSVPLEGPATVECGAFLEAPRGRFRLGQTWEVAEEGRPPRTWKIAGSDVVSGTSCLRIEGLQQSEDWDRPRADRTAWRRRDLLWIAPDSGITYRVERTIERREPARREATQRSVTRYNLESRVLYPDALLEDRRREILLAKNLGKTAEPFLREPEKSGSRALGAIATKIAYHLDHFPATPYREALGQLQRRLEAARRGEATASGFPEEIAQAPRAALNQPAPDFVVTDFTNRDSARLRRLLGRPIVMVFYNPTSRSTPEILRFAQSLADDHPGGVTVLGLAMTTEADPILKQRAELKLTFPILSGQGLRHTYDVEATPKLIVLDSAGFVRGSFVGWGRETPELVSEEVKRWLVPAHRK